MSSSKSYGDHIDKRIARLSPDARDLHKLLVDIPSRPEASLPDYDAGYEAFRSMSQTDREELEVVLVALVNDRDEHTSILASLAYARTAMDSQIVEEAKRIMHRETGRPRDLPMGHIEAFLVVARHMCEQNPHEMRERFRQFREAFARFEEQTREIAEDLARKEGDE